MNINQTIKSLLNNDIINNYKTNLNKQKQEHEQEINELQTIHNEQICKLCNELEKSSTSLDRYKIELDSMRILLKIKEKQIKTKDNQLTYNENIQIKNIELINENLELKKELSLLTNKYQKLIHEMEDARQYVLKMIKNLD